MKCPLALALAGALSFASAASYDLKVEPISKLQPLDGGTTPADLDSGIVSPDGTRLYTAAPGRARIIDLTDIESPTVLGEFGPTAAFIYDIALLNPSTVCLVGDFGLALFDVTNPSSPVQIGTNFPLGTGGLRIGFRIQISGTTAWVTGMFGTRSVSLATPAAPVITGTAATGIAYGMALYGNRAYVAARTAGIRVLDISNPAAPVILSTIPPVSAGNQTRDAVIFGTTLYTAETEQGIRLFNLANPSAPAFIKRIVPNAPGGSGPARFHLKGDRLAVPLYETGTVLYSLADPLNPTVIARMNAQLASTEPFEQFNGRPGDTSGGVWSATTSGDNLIQIEGTRGLSIAPLGTAASLQRIASTAGGTTEALAIAQLGHHVYVAAGENGIKVFNAANPAAPALLTTLDTPGHANSVTISGNLLAVGDGQSGVHLYSLANPASPTLTGTYDTPADAGQCAFASPTRLLVADRSIFVRDPLTLQLNSVIGGALHILNVSNPAAPTLTGTYTPPILSAATPTYPEVKGSILSVSVSGNTALVSNGPKGTYVLDISDPTAPTVLSELGILQPSSSAYFSTSHSLWISPSQAIVGHGFGGWQVVDLSNPASPSVETTMPALGRDTAMHLNGAKLYLSLGHNGLAIYDLSTPASPALQALSTVVRSNGAAVMGDLVLSSGAAHYHDPAETLVTLRFFDPNNSPRFLNPASLPGGGFQCSVLALPGTRWGVMHSSDCINWQGPLTILTGDKNPVTFTDPSLHTRRFYLLRPQ